MKLGATGLGEVRPIATLVTPRALVDLFEAVRTKAVASFSYRQTARRVAPAGLWFRFGHWYLVAWDLDREAVRTFRVDRVEDAVRLGSPGGAVLPEGIDIRASLPDEPWRAEGERPCRHPDPGGRHGGAAGRRRGRERQGREPGATTGRSSSACGWPGSRPLRSWILGLLDHAEILEPPEFRSELMAWLVGHGDRRRDLAERPGRCARLSATDAASAAPPRRSAPVPGRETSQRLRRLLAVVGWLAQVGEAPIADVARRFAMDEEELIRELELAGVLRRPAVHARTR